MTGLLGGGHALYWDGRGRRGTSTASSTSGLGSRAAELVELEVLVRRAARHYAVGTGLVRGARACRRARRALAALGRLPWPRLVEPALRLARDGVEMPPAHAACLRDARTGLHAATTGAAIYSPGGALLQAGERLDQPGLVRALEAIAAEGAASVYDGSLAAALLELRRSAAAPVTRADLARVRGELVGAGRSGATQAREC